MAKSTIWERCLETRDYLQQRVPGFTPQIAVVLGSGLGGFGDRMSQEAVIPYEEIPHFKQVGVVGHSGNLIFGTVGGKKIVCQQGRYHYYEGHTIQEVVFPVRVMSALGAETLLVTNAAGGIDTSFNVGDIMMIRDHINFQGANPLMGTNEDAIGTRFPDMTYAYAPEYRVQVLGIAEEMNLEIREGIYLAVSGPSYETPAEINMFRTLGADAVGMSTVPEVIAANHRGMKCLGLSCISNAAAAEGAEKLDHTHVAEVIDKMSRQFESLVETWIERL
ncbi:MAG: purine-nucleoside phosphorylase [Acidobacteriota bacterium]|nr:purine-nucleoside phosphorylase [Acidobacteriota bacterium]